MSESRIGSTVSRVSLAKSKRGPVIRPATTRRATARVCSSACPSQSASPQSGAGSAVSVDSSTTENPPAPGATKSNEPDESAGGRAIDWGAGRISGSPVWSIARPASMVRVVLVTTPPSPQLTPKPTSRPSSRDRPLVKARSWLRSAAVRVCPPSNTGYWLSGMVALLQSSLGRCPTSSRSMLRPSSMHSQIRMPLAWSMNEVIEQSRARRSAR